MTGLTLPPLPAEESSSSNDVSNVTAVVVPRVREITVQPHRVFINHVDGYHASKLIDVLYDTVFERPEFEKEVIDTEEDKNPKTEVTEEEEEEDVKTEAVDETISKNATSTYSAFSSSGVARKYDLIGTVQNRKIKYIEGVRIVPSVSKNRESFLAEVLRCGFIIFDITQESSQIEEVLWTLNEILVYLDEFERSQPRAFAANQDRRYFILISNVLTWGRTKPLGDRPITETHYRKRKACENFREHLQCERLVFGALKKRPHLQEKIRTLVVCAGVTYGDGEDLLHYAFKLGWLNETHLPVFSGGDNLVPMLHVRDLAAAVFTVIKEWPRLRYVLAVEQKLSTQKNIIKAISRVLSTGKTKKISKIEALEHPEISSRSVDAMTIDLRLESDFLTRSRYMRWRSERDFVANVENIVQEFRDARSIHPVRLIVLGPPASGKSMIARELAKYYRLNFIAIKKLILDTIEELKNQIEDEKKSEEELEKSGEDKDTEEDKDEEKDQTFEDVVEMEKFLTEITTSLEEKKGRLSDSLLAKLFRRKLLSRECRNQGYVIDGYPKTMEQAMMLFASNGVEKADGEDEGVSVDTNDEELDTILPDLVIAFEASDEFLMNRIINLTEKEVANTRYSEDNMTTRLSVYRERNGEDNSPLQLFDELEIHPVILNVEDDDSPQMISTFQYCLALIGETHDYGKSTEELEEERRREDEIKAADKAEKANEQERVNAEIRCQREKRAEQWSSLFERIKSEEEERIKLMAAPLRNYLMKHVLPLITQGLVQVSKLRPDDPVDFLAEYLIKENPEGRLFEPDYNEVASSTLSSIKILQCEGVLPAFEALGDETYEHLRSSTSSSGSQQPEEVQMCECRWFGSSSGDSYEGENFPRSCTCSHPSDPGPVTLGPGGNKVKVSFSGSQAPGVKCNDEPKSSILKCQL